MVTVWSEWVRELWYAVSFRVPLHPAWWSPETPPCSPCLCRELAERDSEQNVRRGMVLWGGRCVDSDLHVRWR